MVDLPKEIIFLDNPVHVKLQTLRLDLLQLSLPRHNKRILKIILTKLEEAELYSLYILDQELPCPKCGAGCCVCEVKDFWRVHCMDCDFELGPFSSADLARKAWNTNVRKELETNDNE